MNCKEHGLAIGVFTDHAQADRAVSELKQRGFRNDQIGSLGRDWRQQGKAENDKGTAAGEGALVGVLTGAGLGGLVGLGVLAGVIPVIGPAIAAGTLGVILTNAAGGAAIAGVAGALMGVGLSEDDAHYYEGEVRSGRHLVTVRSDDRFEEARDILRRFGAIDRSAAANEVSTRQETMYATDQNRRREVEENVFHTEKHHV